MNWLKHKLRTWLGLERDAANSERRDGTLDSMHRALMERTRKLEAIVYAEQQSGVDMAVSRDEASHFILFGTYKGRDYVEVIPVQGAGFGELTHGTCGAIVATTFGLTRQ